MSPRASGGERLDIVCVERGLCETRARAQAVIMGGGVLVDGVAVTKPSHAVSSSSTVELARDPNPYVSRGGLKLAHALHAFNLDVGDRITADVGASTGGFTDVLLQAGAGKVYAIDVGYGQLAWKLRNDERVVVMERTNIKDVRELPDRIDFAAIDTSFISLTQVLPAVRPLLAPTGSVVALVKPQFEAGRDQARKGVVRDPAVWQQVLLQVSDFAERAGWFRAGLTPSPIRGPAGNVEFLLWLERSGAGSPQSLQDMVAAAVANVMNSH